MKKSKLFLPFFLLIFSSCLLTAQTIEWKGVYSTSSIGMTVSETSSGNYLVCGYNNQDDKGVASLHRPDGEFIWKKDIVDDPRIFLKGLELDDGSLLFVDGNGNVFQTTADGENLTLLFNIHPPGEPLGYVEEVVQRDSLILISGSARRNGKIGRLHALVSLPSLELEPEIFIEGATSITGIGFGEDHTITECVFTTSTIFIFRKIKLDGTPVWEKEIVKDERHLIDLTVASNDHIYITGRVRDSLDQDRFHGLLMNFDQDGELVWEKQYRTVVDTNKVRLFLQIDQQDDYLILGGRERQFYGDSKVSAMKCDLNGDPIWHLHEKIMGGSHETGDVLFNRDGKTIICGTTELTDYTGPERLFVMAVNDLIASYKDEASTLLWELYPVPTNDYLHLNLPALVDDYTLEAFDNNGRIIGKWKNQTQVDVRHLPAGNYWLRMTFEEQSSAQQWMKVE